MKKKFLLLLAATLASASGWATNLEVGERIEYNDLVFRIISTSENEGEVEVVGFEVPGGEDSIIIPSTLTHGDDTYTVVSIVENAFQGTGLREISIPATVKTIGKDAFAGSWAQYQSGCKIAYGGSMADWCDINFANGDANPLQLAYKDVTKITMKNMYENITFAGNHIFEETVDNFNNRFYTFRISDDVKVIKPYAFYGANAIVSVAALDGLLTVGDYAFYNNKMLELVDLAEEDARSVGAHAFESCPRLSSIFLGCNINELGENAFVGCPALKTVDAYNLTPAEIAKFDDVVYANATLTVPAGSSFDYEKAEGWKEFANIEEGAEVYNITIGWDEAYGTVLYLGEKWEEFNVMRRSVELYICPDEGYEIRSITVNGNEMLSLYDEQNNMFDLGEIDEDKDIVVYFDEKDGGIDEAGAQDVSVRGADGAIIVEGLGQDTTVNVYNISGQLVYSGNDSVINTVSGVYVIEISGKVYKTVVR